MSEGYVDQIAAFRYRGRTVEAHVARTQVRGAKRLSSASGIWVILVDDERYVAFPASANDAEEEMRERIKRWIDEHLPAGGD